MVIYMKGQRVRIVHGNYKKNGAGTFIEETGTVSCRVNIDLDAPHERNIRLSSIAPFPPSSPSSFRKSTAGGKSPYKGRGSWSPSKTSNYDQRKESREELLEELRCLKTDMNQRINRLEKKIKAIPLDD